MKEKQQSRAQWGSNLGFILAAAGSAVGLGNIWKFPGKAYEGGGATFIAIYIAIVFIIGFTVMLTEFTVGRTTQKNAVGAFVQLNKKWKWIGGMGVLTGFIILTYYVQVGGWVIQYVFGYLTESSFIFSAPKDYFLNMLGTNGFPLMGAIIFPLMFLGLTVLIITKGVEQGIEKVSKVLMPILILLLIALMVRSVTLEGASEGVKYLLTFNPDEFTLQTVMSALGQAFFSLSLGMGVMCTYGSYLSKQENLIKSTGIICLLDTFITIIAGFAIIPAVFASGVEPGMGVSFAFVSLATVFQQMPFGAFFGLLFYVLLFFAALTSAISILEGTVAYLTEEKKLNRKKATYYLGIIVFIIGTFYTLSQVYMPIKGVWLDGKTGLSFPLFCNFLEYLTDRLLLPLGSFCFCIFVGWIWGTKNAIAEVRQGGLFRFASAPIWTVLVKFVAPVAILGILISGLIFGTNLS